MILLEYRLLTFRKPSGDIIHLPFTPTSAWDWRRFFHHCTLTTTRSCTTVCKIPFETSSAPQPRNTICLTLPSNQLYLLIHSLLLLLLKYGTMPRHDSKRPTHTDIYNSLSLLCLIRYGSSILSQQMTIIVYLFESVE
jgi:hypothetical protein